MKIKSSPFPPHPLPYSPLSPSERVANVHVRVVSFRNGSISLSTWDNLDEIRRSIFSGVGWGGGGGGRGCGGEGYVGGNKKTIVR